LGWLDAATTSLKRATTLSSDTPLISHSRRLFKAGSVQLTPREISSSYPTGLDDMERFQLALLGITTPGDQDDSVRGKFAGALISLALGAPPAQSVTR
jgi:hypothetical protein